MAVLIVTLLHVFLYSTIVLARGNNKFINAQLMAGFLGYVQLNSMV